VDKFICDDLRQLQHVAAGGFPIHFFAAGLPDIYAELGEVVSGQKPGRESSDERIMSLNLGMGIMDVVVGHRIYQRALERGLGTQLDLN
jgi:ornithine cyclodeaminase/alanine dehydrogenase-like protein (mu-crystallin family)